MPSFDDLKAKYQPVLDLIPTRGVSLSHVNMDGDKLFVQGAAPSDDIKNEIWNAIKAIDPTYSDLICDLSVDTSLPQPAPAADAAPATTQYTVKPGDSLWKIAQETLGNGSLFPKIISKS